MCFPPQPRALFEHLNFEKCSSLTSKRASHHQKCWSFWHFDFQTSFSQQPRALFQGPQLPKVLAFSTSKRSRHNGVHFQPLNFQKIFALLRATAACNFDLSSPEKNPPLSEPTFRPPGATKHRKHRAFRNLSTFSRALIFFLVTLFSDFSLRLFLFSDSSHHCCRICPQSEA